MLDLCMVLILQRCSFVRCKCTHVSGRWQSSTKKSLAVSWRAQSQQEYQEVLVKGPLWPFSQRRTALTYLRGVLDETDRLQPGWTFYTVSGVCLSEGRRNTNGGVSTPNPNPKTKKKILSRGGLTRKFNGHLLGGGVTCVHAQNFMVHRGQ